MENIVENQASTQSTMPEQGAANPAPQPPAMTPEMQAVWAELEQLATNPEALQAKATQFGMSDQYKTLRDGLAQMQVRAQELMQKEQTVTKQFNDLTQRAKSTSNKMMAGVVAIVLAGGFIGYKIINKDVSTIRKIMTAVGSGVVGGVTGGLIGRMVFGSKIQDEAKELTLQAQQVEVGKEQLQAEAAALQQPFVMELANKMAASKKAAPAADIAPPSVAAPAPGASSQSLDDKVGDQSIKLSQESVTNTPAAVSSQSTLVGGVQPRGSHTGAAVAAKEQLAGVAATR